LEVKKTPLEAGKRLGSYEVRSGYTVELRATDKLPLGYFRADLHLALSKLGADPDRTITVPVYAVVGNGSFDVSPSVLRFTKPSITDGDTAKVNLTFINPPADMSVKVKSFEPKFLQVDEPVKLAPGRWRITAHIPKDNPDAAKLQADPDGMEGQVVLEVDGLDRPFPIRVRWNPHAR
jgi:hypothetical protein